MMLTEKKIVTNENIGGIITPITSRGFAPMSAKVRAAGNPDDLAEFAENYQYTGNNFNLEIEVSKIPCGLRLVLGTDLDLNQARELLEVACQRTKKLFFHGQYETTRLLPGANVELRIDVFYNVSQRCKDALKVCLYPSYAETAYPSLRVKALRSDVLACIPYYGQIGSERALSEKEIDTGMLHFGATCLRVFTQLCSNTRAHSNAICSLQ